MFSEMNMTLTQEKVSANMERYVLKATLVGEDGNTYEVNAVHENIVPKGKVESVILDATITTGEWDFTLERKNEDIDIKLVINNTDIVGTYGMNMVKWEDSKIAYKGVEVTPLTFKALVNLATHTVDNSLAYVTEITMMGNDTIDYHFVIAAPLPAPTDTIELTAVDLKVDDSSASFFGSIDFYASTNDFAIRGGWQATIIEEGTYKAAIFLDDAKWNTITSLEAEITISLDQNYNWVIDGSMLGSNNKVYNLHLTWSVPEQTDTVLVAFEHSARAKYYPHLENDIQIYNENDLYSASINVAGVELGGEFGEEQVIDYFTYLELKDGTVLNVAEKVNGKLYQVGDTTKMEMDYVTFQGILYQVRLWHVASTPTKTVNLTIENAEFIQDFFIRALVVIVVQASKRNIALREHGINCSLIVIETNHQPNLEIIALHHFLQRIHHSFFAVLLTDIQLSSSEVNGRVTKTGADQFFSTLGALGGFSRFFGHDLCE
jgi:hypothetical protein